MESKRELTSVDLAAVVRELGASRGAVVDKAYLYGEDLVRLKLRDPDRGRAELLIEVGDVKRAHLVAPEHVAEAPDRPPDFARKLRSRVAGGTLEGVDQHGFDRILTVRFERPDESTTLVAELFGDGNVVVLDPTDRVVACLETIRLKSRTVAPGSQYEFPAERVNPLTLSREAFHAHVRESDTDLVRTLATQLDLGGTWGEEICTRADVSKTRPVDEADDEEIDALYAAVRDLAETLESGDFDPRVYREDDHVVDATPVPMAEHDSLESESHDTFMAALDAYFVALEAAGEETPGRPDFDEEIEKFERIRAQQAEAIERFEREADREREKAEALYAHYDLVDEVIQTVRRAREDGHGWEAIEERLAEGADRGIAAAEAVTGVNPEAGTVSLTLDDYSVAVDPSVGVEHNADRLYKEAKAIEEKRDGAEEALAETEERLAAVESRREAWEAGEGAEEPEPTEAATATPADWLARESIPVRKPDHWYEQFRWFHTSDGFLVLGGRDADDNEALVRKYLDPGDRFLHTQARGGPVTVLKATGPSEPTREVDFPERTLEEAAQFAVSYSSVWKDGAFSGDVYLVEPDQVSKTPESGEYLEKGGFAIRGERSYFRDVAVGCVVGIECEPETRVIGGPPRPVEDRAVTSVAVEPGEFAQGDVAKRIYRQFRERFTDTSFVRKVASPDEIGKFLPPGTSRIRED